MRGHTSQVSTDIQHSQISGIRPLRAIAIIIFFLENFPWVKSIMNVKNQHLKGNRVKLESRRLRQSSKYWRARGKTRHATEQNPSATFRQAESNVRTTIEKRGISQVFYTSRILKALKCTREKCVHHEIFGKQLRLEDVSLIIFKRSSIFLQ